MALPSVDGGLGTGADGALHLDVDERRAVRREGPPGGRRQLDRLLPGPATPDRWQFLVDIVPGQVASERLSRLRGVDCDSFLYCPYIIETEGGLE